LWWPSGTLTTTLLPTTDPSGSGDMLHIVTDSGDYGPAEQGNGWYQGFIGGVLLADATVTYDLDVVSGSVTGGLVASDGRLSVEYPDQWPHRRVDQGHRPHAARLAVGRRCL
jgi:hypothetical protein